MAEIRQVVGGVLAGAAASSAPARKPSAPRAPAERMLQGCDVALRFRFERGDDSVRILVVDRNTGEVIRTIPPEYFTAAVGLKGLVLDENL